MLKKIAIIPIRFYQLAISPLLGNRCRYNPTCSHYMIEAIEEWGVFKGIYLGMRRIGRCHPFSKRDMYDPVPKTKKSCCEDQEEIDVQKP